MAKITTTLGDVEESSLVTSLVQEESEKYITLAREWRLDGEIVRRDVWVTLKTGESFSGEVNHG